MNFLTVDGISSPYWKTKTKKVQYKLQLFCVWRESSIWQCPLRLSLGAQVINFNMRLPVYINLVTVYACVFMYM